MHAPILAIADLIMFAAILMPVLGIVIGMGLPMVADSHVTAGVMPPPSGSASPASMPVVVAPPGSKPSAEGQESGLAVPPSVEALPESHPVVVVAPPKPAAVPEPPAASPTAPGGSASPPPYSQALTQHDARYMLVFCVADTPWGNTGEALIGAVTELADGQKVLCVTDDSGASYNISLDEPGAQIRELP